MCCSGGGGVSGAGVWGGAGRRLDRYPQYRPGCPAAARPVLQPGSSGAAGAALLSTVTRGPHHARQAAAVGGAGQA